jgi:hypothetical protein
MRLKYDCPRAALITARRCIERLRRLLVGVDQKQLSDLQNGGFDTKRNFRRDVRCGQIRRAARARPQLKAFDWIVHPTFGTYLKRGMDCITSAPRATPWHL